VIGIDLEDPLGAGIDGFSIAIEDGGAMAGVGLGMDIEGLIGLGQRLQQLQAIVLRAVVDTNDPVGCTGAFEYRRPVLQL